MNAKAAFLAFTCILIAGLCNATADELLDLKTRDLAEMKTVSGVTLVFDPGKISMVYTLPRALGSSSSRSGPRYFPRWSAKSRCGWPGWRGWCAGID